MNLESQCIPHSMLLPILFFDDSVRITENVIGCCKTTHYDLRCIGTSLLLARVLCHTLAELNKEEPSNQARCQYLKEEYSKVKKYFQEEKDQAIMERILEVKDDWSDLLSIRNEIEEKQLGEVYECFLYATFFYVYDYPYINAMMRIFIEGGNSCTNSFVVGALIGAKQGVNKVVLSAPVCDVVDGLTCSCLLRTSFIRIISFSLSTDYSTL